jgi:carbonic anhydrase
MRLCRSSAAPFLAAALALAGCTTSAPPQAAAPAAAPAVQEKRWAYVSGPETAGPAEWGSLPGNSACSTGKRQSPVPLVAKGPSPNAEAKDLPNLVFRYGKTGLHLVNKGHTIQANVDPGSTLEAAGATWTLVQFHFHAPSEHALDGLQYPMEMHLAHAGPDGKPGLVVGVLLAQGGETRALAPVFAAMPKEKDAKTDRPDVTIDLEGLLPPDRTYFTYDGSLTTPPCTEGIRWIVLASPGGLSAEQMGAFVSIPRMTPTSRPLQPLAGRTVQIDSTP